MENNIIEGNKIIAELMGGKIVDTQSGENVRFYNEHNEIHFVEHVNLLQYHSSWDSLMPVCQEVKEICTVDEWWILAEALFFFDINKLWTGIVNIVTRYNKEQNAAVNYKK